MKATRAQRGRQRHWVSGALAGLAAMYGALLFTESFYTQDVCCLATWPNPNPLQTERVLFARDKVGLNAAAQEAAARAVLAARPADSSGWIRLAHADTLRNGRLTSQGVDALRTSYLMSAYAARNVGWRLSLALQSWDELDTDTKRQALAEIKVLQTDGMRLAAAKQQIGAVSDPVGRTYAALYDLLPPPAPPNSGP